MRTAETILAQLGGNKFMVMTGAKGFCGDDNGLQFSLPRMAGNKVNKVRIMLDHARDCYEIKFYNLRGVNCNLLSETTCYADNLQEVFTKYTGRDTHL